MLVINHSCAVYIDGFIMRSTVITAIAYSATYYAADETTLSDVHVNQFLRCHWRSPTFISRFASLANILSLSLSPPLCLFALSLSFSALLYVRLWHYRSLFRDNGLMWEKERGKRGRLNDLHRCTIPVTTNHHRPRNPYRSFRPVCSLKENAITICSTRCVSQ